MTIEQFQEAWHQRPFRPFTSHMADGRTLEVPHPDFVARSQTGRTAIVFHPQGEKWSVVDLLLMSELEFHNGDGQASQ
jgi:hypothetical protein